MEKKERNGHGRILSNQDARISNLNKLADLALRSGVYPSKVCNRLVSGDSTIFASRKCKVVGWVSWKEVDELNKFIDKFSGEEKSFDVFGDLFNLREYREIEMYLKANIKRNKYAFGGREHQSNFEGCPIVLYNDGKDLDFKVERIAVVQLSFKDWDEIMESVWGESPYTTNTSPCELYVENMPIGIYTLPYSDYIERLLRESMDRQIRLYSECEFRYKGENLMMTV